MSSLDDLVTDEDLDEYLQLDRKEVNALAAFLQDAVNEWAKLGPHPVIDETKGDK